jgi:hypothetical protein
LIVGVAIKSPEHFFDGGVPVQKVVLSFQPSRLLFFSDGLALKP